MFKPHTWENLLFTIAFRYFILAGFAFLIFYKILRQKIAYKKIQFLFPANKDYKREIAYSLLTIVIFTIVPSLILFTSLKRYTHYYSRISDHSMVYFYLAIPLMFIIHDTYFYWTHRLMHHPKLFKAFHVIHHKSTNPSPWAAFAFQPTEAFIEAGTFVVLIVIMPLHFIHLLVFFLVMMIYNVYGHSGWELYPRW